MKIVGLFEGLHKLEFTYSYTGGIDQFQKILHVVPHTQMEHAFPQPAILKKKKIRTAI